MSENYYKFECISSEPEQLAFLYSELARFSDEESSTDGALRDFLGEWDEPSIEPPSLYGNLLLFSIVTSNHDLLSKRQVLALHELGADYIRVNTEFGQVGESKAFCYHAGKKIPAKSFPQPDLDDAGKAYMLLEEGADSALAELINNGLPPDLYVQGRPLLIRVCAGSLKKSLTALVAAGVDLDVCRSYPTEFAMGISCLKSQKVRRGLLKTLLDGGADVNKVWMASFGFYSDPVMMSMLIAAGADINQRLADRWGSLLFHSMDLFNDDPDLVALLQRHGAKDIPPEPFCSSIRLERLLDERRGAETIEEILADGGVDLNAIIRGMPVAVYALRSKPSISLRLINAGASVSEWLGPKYVGDFISCLAGDNAEPLCEGEAQAVVEIFKLLLNGGHDASVRCCAYVYVNGRCHVHYRGTLFALLVLFCCIDGNRLATVRLPLARLFVEHKVDVSDLMCNEPLATASVLKLNLSDDYTTCFSDKRRGSLLYFLESTDGQVSNHDLIRLLENYGAQSIVVDEPPQPNLWADVAKEYGLELE